MARLTSVFSNQQPLRKVLTRTVPLDRPGPLNTFLNDLAFITDAEKQAASVYLLNPPLDIFKSSPKNAEETLAFWCKTLGEMNDRGEEGHVFGPPGIPSAYAHLWWNDNASLSSMIPRCTDLNVEGVHCIVLINTSKRPSDPESEESPSKRQHVWKASRLPASEIAITDVDARHRLVEKANSLLATLAPLAARASGEIHHPNAITCIPLPTLTSSNWNWRQRFQLTKINGVVYFDYCGRRRVLEDIICRMTDLRDMPYAHSIAFLGTKGQGRTHILTAAAAILLSQGLPVVFLPFSPNPRTAEIRDAILVALQNTELLKPYTSELFEYCCKYPGRAGLLRFCNRLRSKDLKLIFVALNLDVLSPTELLDCQSMMDGHDVIFTADGNSSLALKAEEKAPDGWGSVLYLNNGLEQDEVDAWLWRYEIDLGTTLRKEQRDLLHATTRNLPSLLSEVLRAAKAKGDFDQGLRSLRPNVTLQMQKHMRQVQASPNELRKLLLAVLSNGAFSALPSLPDRRYMYEDENGRWQYTSLFAYEAAYRIALELYKIPFASSTRYSGCRVSHSLPTTHRCWDTLLSMPSRRLQNLYPSAPPFSSTTWRSPNNVHAGGLYALEFNHRYVDCVAVWFEGTVVHVVPIQISNVCRTADHADSRDKFFSSDWQLWERAFRKPRGPAHEAFTTGFVNISQKIAGALDPA
ncbi:hypothetical protein GGX14DRAFT_642292 [Mycena pura]|uniref:Uncharacterized protein n=1 Tax=Mycena pura TaxID=153505 RepID=A0AAD7E3Y4_9AGAR|nr:hypothetical protein GGX14DRAFT_642292 [Mycena pura]